MLSAIDISRDSWLTLTVCVVGGVVVYMALSLLIRQEEAELLILRVEQSLARALRR